MYTCLHAMRTMVFSQLQEDHHGVVPSNDDAPVLGRNLIAASKAHDHEGLVVGASTVHRVCARWSKNTALQKLARVDSGTHTHLSPIHV